MMKLSSETPIPVGTRAHIQSAAIPIPGGAARKPLQPIDLNDLKEFSGRKFTLRSPKVFDTSSVPDETSYSPASSSCSITPPPLSMSLPSSLAIISEQQGPVFFGPEPLEASSPAQKDCLGWATFLAKDQLLSQLGRELNETETDDLIQEFATVLEAMIETGLISLEGLDAQTANETTFICHLTDHADWLTSLFEIVLTLSRPKAVEPSLFTHTNFSQSPLFTQSVFDYLFQDTDDAEELNHSEELRATILALNEAHALTPITLQAALIVDTHYKIKFPAALSRQLQVFARNFRYLEETLTEFGNKHQLIAFAHTLQILAESESASLRQFDISLMLDLQTQYGTKFVADLVQNLATAQLLLDSETLRMVCQESDDPKALVEAWRLLKMLGLSQESHLKKMHLFFATNSYDSFYQAQRKSFINDILTHLVRDKLPEQQFEQIANIYLMVPSALITDLLKKYKKIGGSGYTMGRFFQIFADLNDLLIRQLPITLKKYFPSFDCETFQPEIILRMHHQIGFIPACDKAIQEVLMSDERFKQLLAPIEELPQLSATPNPCVQLIQPIPRRPGLTSTIFVVKSDTEKKEGRTSSLEHCREGTIFTPVTK